MNGAVQVGQLVTREINLDPALYTFVGLSILDQTGTQIGSKIAMTNVIDTLWLASFTPGTAGIYVLRVAVYTDAGMGTILPFSPRSSEAIQVVDTASIVLDAATAAHNNPGSIGAAIEAAGGSVGALLDPHMTAAANPQSDTLAIAVWMEQSNQIVTSPTSASITVMGTDGTVAFSQGPNTDPTAQGVFNFSQTAISSKLNANFSYFVVVQITVDSTVYTALRPFTVF